MAVTAWTHFSRQRSVFQETEPLVYFFIYFANCSVLPLHSLTDLDISRISRMLQVIRVSKLIQTQDQQKTWNCG